MKEFICKKDFYINDVRFSIVGDHVVLLDDNRTVVNNNGKQKVLNLPDIVNDKEYFTPTFEPSKIPKDSIKSGDKVNHPSHYTWLKEKCGIEVIDITRWLDFDTGNAVKYLLRAGHKTEEGYSDKQKEMEDLEKAEWYIKDRINQLKKEL